MYEDCKKAEISIEYEQYIFENDVVGRRFMRLFIEKAAQGVSVFLICDKYGSGSFFTSPLVRKLRRVGGHFHFYNPLRWWQFALPWYWFPRTHTKTLLIDSNIAYTGGVCIAERMPDWRDTQIRVTGPVVAEIRRSFDKVEKRVFRRYHGKIKRPPLTIPPGDGHFSYLTNQPRRSRHHLFDELIRSIRHAEKYIYLTTAYFVPHNRFIELLEQAARRGVDVRLLVPERSDILLADYVCLSYVPRLRRAGIGIYHYHKSLLHSKTAVIDDSWGTVGSTNFDLLSFFHNREANIMTSEPLAVAELKAHFMADLKHSYAMTPYRWAAIPRWKPCLGYFMRVLKLFL